MTSRSRFRERLRNLGHAAYRDYLSSEHWADVRTRYAASRLVQRCFCGETRVDLHHRTYKRLGAEHLSDLVPLCRQHHEEVHRQEKPKARRGLWGETRRIIRSLA